MEYSLIVGSDEMEIIHIKQLLSKISVTFEYLCCYGFE